MEKGVLYWITGLSGAGKTTIGNYLYYVLKQTYENVVLLDGDILKNIVSDSCDYSDTDRRNRAMKYAKLCKTLTDQGLIVICCTIAMYHDVRDWNRKNNRGYVEVFLDVPMEVLMQRDQKGMYSSSKRGEFTNLAGVDLSIEYPCNPDITIKNDGKLSVKECVNRILSTKIYHESDFNRDTHYWNYYYASDPDISQPSLFAQWIINENKMSILNNSEKSCLLELGCGNGRDALYFYSNGINVTAIDASDKIIADLNGIYEKDDDINFICDDFVCSTALYQGQYDYCYSRFTLHAISRKQEIQVIQNVEKALRSNGSFFIEVRSINDELCGKGRAVGDNAYVYNGHYRRFIVKNELEESLRNIGFIIDYSEESTGFAPFENTDPPIIRIIARKK